MTNASESPVAVITGGGRGMGAAIARELHGRGYRVALMSPSGSAAVLAAELDGLGFTGSASDRADLAGLVELTLERFGRIDAVVNNTGHPTTAPLLEITDAMWAEANEASSCRFNGWRSW